MNFHYTTAAFTLPFDPRGFVMLHLQGINADSPKGWAFYAVSVRRLIALRDRFLQTTPRNVALAFG